MKVYIGADHRGFELKEKLIEWLKSNGYQAEDCGAYEHVLGDDYVDFAAEVGKRVANEEGNRGIVICRSGAGVDIVANKIRGIRCSLGFSVEQVRMARADDDLNILALASDFISNFQDAQLMVKAFLQTEFKPTENHLRRIGKIKSLE